MTTAILKHGDCLETLKSAPDNHFDSVVTDPPAGIAFMGKEWDEDKGGRDAWIAWMQSVMAECLRVLKPGGHALVWSLPRTSHWTATALENAGFEIRDCVTHLFGTGFPKSLDVSKAIDKAAGAEREKIGSVTRAVGDHHYDNGSKMGRFGSKAGCYNQVETDITAPATDDAKRWQGWGTALKPAAEFWWLCRKPLSEKTVAANVLKWGCGALNIDASRIAGHNPSIDRRATARKTGVTPGAPGEYGATIKDRISPEAYKAEHPSEQLGRFPANLILDEEAAAALDEQSLAGGMHSAGKPRGKGEAKQTNDGALFGIGNHDGNGARFGDSGGASRFFYVAKASKSDKGADNTHPTVKSTALMTYLIRLVTPPGGIVLDPFMGSGSTGVAALKDGFKFVGIEQFDEYFNIALKRVK